MSSMITKTMFVFWCIVMIVVPIISAEDTDQEMIDEFLKKFKNMNVEEIMANDRLFQAYHKCFLDQGACTPDARDMKRLIPVLVRTSCGTCTEEQKKELKKHLDYAKHKRQQEWDALLDKYDPKRESLEKFLASVPT